MAIYNYPEAVEGSLNQKSASAELIKGRSLTLPLTNRYLTRQETNDLNELYFENCKKRPIYMMVLNAPLPDTPVFESEGQIKLWLGRQFGEVLLSPTYNEKSGRLEATAKKKATDLLWQLMRLNATLAHKYICMNENGFFKEEMKDNLRKHWERRAGIKLENYGI